MTFYDGQEVAYVGPEMDGLMIGAQGRVVQADISGSHVLWATGGLTFVDHIDLTPLVRKQAVTTVEVGGLSAVAVRDNFDQGGEVALLNLMAENGHLGAFLDIAEEALTLIAKRIREDEAFQTVAAALDSEENDALITLATRVLIRDAFGEDD